MLAWWSILLIIFIAYSILAWSVYFMQSSFIYRPVRNVPYTPTDMDLIYEKVALKTADGLKIAAWFIPCEKAKMTVLFCHGNGGNMAHRLDTINILNELGLNCLIFDYRGYGDSQGKTTENGTYLDAQAAWKWLTHKKGIKAEQIIIFGRSLGGSVAANLAARTIPAGLILESAFTSFPAIGAKYYPYLPVKLFAAFSYNTVESLKKINCPLLVMHSKRDEIVPYEFGPQIYEAANEPKEFVEILGCHNDGFLFSGQTYRNAWANWLESIHEYNYESDNQIQRQIS
ncbi:MAG: alpha/beta hydrolase [Planctomycetes bacterium]|nr:alpha/beta hydrolase [Planctomycetota bacterium]